ncbi:DUF945 family protein [Vibrio parahaemolyticus]|uniref:DUF945 family protein n=1 Tax=Vibrio parahaemolyticus TaxID=670 RepID=UPI00387B9CF5
MSTNKQTEQKSSKGIILASAIAIALAGGTIYGNHVFTKKYEGVRDGFIKDFSSNGDLSIKLVNAEKGFFSVTDTFELSMKGHTDKLYLKNAVKIRPGEIPGKITLDFNEISESTVEEIPQLKDISLNWVAKADGKFKFELDFPDMQKSEQYIGSYGRKIQSQFRIKGVSLSGEFDKDQMSAVYQIENLNIKDGDKTFDISKFGGTETYKWKNGWITEAKTDFSVDRIMLNENKEFIDFGKLTATSDLTMTDSMSIHQKIKLDGVTGMFNGIKLKESDYTLDWELNDVYMKDIIDASETSDDISRNMSGELLSSMFKKGITFKINELKSDWFDIDLDVKFKSFSEEPRTLHEFLEKVTAELNVSVDKAMTAKLGIPPFMIQDHIDQGVISDNGKNIETHAEVKEGTLTINGNEIPLPKNI